MQISLKNKQIIVGVTGGIAAYKSADLIRRLREAGAVVRVVMTTNAKEFITPLTLQALSGNPVHDDLFDLQAEAAMGHIELARWADAVTIAPASADFIARLAHGEANDLLTTLCLATTVPILLAPAMNQAMWKNTRTQKNLQALCAFAQISLLAPEEGSQACGDVGPGRMMEPQMIIHHVSKLFSRGRLAGKTILITAGPTREAIDPVRYLTNASSGKMGYALAQAAREASANVILISGPVALSPPAQVTIRQVETAAQMYAAVMDEVSSADLFISVAAVSDYRCTVIAPTKISKHAASLTLELEKTQDIIAAVAALSDRPIVIGFAAQTDDVLEKAQDKLIRKKLDMIIANDVSHGLGFDSDENAAVALWGQHRKAFSCMSKTKLADKLLNLITDVFVENDYAVDLSSSHS